MTDFEKEPEEGHQQEFESIERFGESKLEEYSGLKERLGPNENIKMISTSSLKGEDKYVICLTDKRVLLFNSDKSKLLGKRKQFEDIKLDQIRDIQVDERKDFDKVNIETEAGKKELMAPEGKGLAITGLVRGQQQTEERDPADQLEKIGREKEKGNISEEEYEDKKDKLMDEI